MSFRIEGRSAGTRHRDWINKDGETVRFVQGRVHTGAEYPVEIDLGDAVAEGDWPVAGEPVDVQVTVRAVPSKDGSKAFLNYRAVALILPD